MIKIKQFVFNFSKDNELIFDLDFNSTWQLYRFLDDNKVNDNLVEVKGCIIRLDNVNYIKELTGKEEGFKECKYCNKAFKPNKSDQIFCSKSCREKHHYHKNKEEE